MKAEPGTQLRLLDVQACDLALDQATYRRGHLPELAHIDQQRLALDAVDQELAPLEVTLTAVDKKIRTLENEVEQFGERVARNRQRMESGAVPAKELANMQHELDTLAARQSELEDQELRLMEEREEVQASIAEIAAHRDELTGRLSDVESARDAAYAEIDQETVSRVAERAQLVGALPEELLSQYEKIRAANAGIGAAELRARRCGGCRLELSRTALAEIQAAADDEVIRCEECGRILVRTKESGL